MILYKIKHLEQLTINNFLFITIDRYKVIQTVLRIIATWTTTICMLTQKKQREEKSHKNLKAEKMCDTSNKNKKVSNLYIYK